MLKDENPSVVLSTVVVLAEAGDKRVAQPMIPVLKHKDPAVRYVASEALIKIPEGVEELQENEPINVQVLFGRSGLGDCPNRNTSPGQRL